jgi:hypothetical protein
MRYNKENGGFGKDPEAPRVLRRDLLAGLLHTQAWEPMLRRWLR